MAVSFQMNALLIVILSLIGAKLLVELLLDFLNRRRVMESAGKVPEAYQSFIDPATYDKSVAYTLDKNRLSCLQTVYDAIILCLILLTGVLPWLWESMTGWTGTGVWGQGISLFAITWLLGLFGLPFDWYQQFRLEERFGFNKSTLKLWLSDKVKGLLIGAVIGIPVIAFLLWLVQTTPLWWAIGFVAIFVFQLAMMVLYPMFILPLFNKFEPLPEGELRDRLMELGERTGFHAKTILVMDGSRRSGHSNAYFTGFGRFRRIVLYDTLVEQMEARELEAVLAHEIGHYKLGHIPKLLAVSGVMLLLSFYVIGLLERSPWFIESFGFVANGSVGPVFLLFGLLAGLFTFWTGPLFNLLSRKHEYEADAFAKQALSADPQPLIEALRNLSEKNLSNLTPHPFYSAFHYSHPTLMERERALFSRG
jgi:STE24 endopeptidase